MPTRHLSFDTPAPLRLLVHNPAGEVQVVASDVIESRVEITPLKSSGQDAVDDTHVELSPDASRLEIRPPSHRFGGSQRLEIRVVVPTGSSLVAKLAAADLTSRGRLSQVEVDTASGDVVVDVVADDARIRSASGDVVVGEVGGSLEAGSASGDVRIGPVGGDCRVHSASGDLHVGPCGQEFTARTASGRVDALRIGSGPVSVTTMSGDVRVGVARGARVWLDVSTLSGRTRSELDHSDAAAEAVVDRGDPDQGAVPVHIKTLSGDVTLVRAGT